MSTLEPNPIHVPMNDPHPCDPQRRESTKACVALTPPISLPTLVGEQLPLQDGAAQTFVVDLNALGGGVLGKSEKDAYPDEPVGEYQTDGSCFPPPPHGEVPLSPLTVNLGTASAGASPTGDSTHSASINTPIDPPGLTQPLDNPPVNDASVRADEVLSSVDADAHRTASSRFSLSGLETLRSFIPDNLFPDDLLVYDPDNLTNLSIDKTQSSPDIPVRYVRAFPQASHGTSPESAACSDRSSGDYPVRVGHLYLKEENKLGRGSHSSVYSAPFSLRLDAESHEVSTVRVAVKVAFAECGAHEMLRREAVAYNAFPRHLMEDQYVAGSQSNLCLATTETSDGAAHPTSEPEDATCPTSTSDDASGMDAGEATAVPCSDSIALPNTEPGLDVTTPSTSTSDDASADGGASKHTHTVIHHPAVVPKFFGYYAPVDVDGSVVEHSHPSCDIDSACNTNTWPTRLLLMEECGKPIEPDEHPQKQRICCVELVRRLHSAGFTQGSLYARNVLVQPGPLFAPPKERSILTPSFRIIDFGRAQMAADFSSENGTSFDKMRDWEEDQAYGVIVHDEGIFW